MFGKKTLYISDLDGTLLNQNAELSEYTINSLNIMISNGLNFTIATARDLDSTKIILTNLALHTPVAIMSGVAIYDFKLECPIKVHFIPFQDIVYIMDIFNSPMAAAAMFKIRKEIIVCINNTFKCVDSFQNTLLECIAYITLVDIYERLKPLHDVMKDHPNIGIALYNDTYKPDLWYLDIFSSNASKENAVTYLRETYGFEKVVGFGDNFNDLQMLSVCDVRISVANAQPEVQSIADYICDTNTNDGVAKWIEMNASLLKVPDR